jgi:SAM-dependent methyltransferase
VCGADEMPSFDPEAIPLGLTSDCKPWPRCGTFAVCRACGHVQKVQDSQWQADVTRIYRDYEMYALSGGSEQVLFEGDLPVLRSRRLLDHFRRHVALSPTGTMLDVGCGNGSTLRSFAELYPGWRLAGFDVHDRFRPIVEAIPGVGAFHCGPLESIDCPFDLISLVYVIEHLRDPPRVLRGLRRLLKPGGVLLVQTSAFWDNPFDLTVVDHCSHFAVDTLAATVRRAGLDTVLTADDWIAKEIGVVARRSECAVTPTLSPARIRELGEGTGHRLRWLQAVVRQAQGEGCVGIFGTAIAGTWLASMLGQGVRFFVDEDRQRQGKLHLGRPVLAPEDAPFGAAVYLAFAPGLARKLHQRLRSRFPGLRYIVPPDFERLPSGSRLTDEPSPGYEGSSAVKGT